jgi:leucine efflux protein
LIYGITDLTTFVLGTIFIVLLPGPNSLYVITLASKRGVAAGYWGAFGIFAGDTVLMLLAATGAASVLYASPTVFTGLKLIGAAYLAWLGIGLVRAGVATWAHRDKNAAHTDLEKPADTRQYKTVNNDLKRPFRTALVISLLNPKAIMFFISFFVQFVDPGYAYPALSFLILGVIVQISSLLYLSALIFGGAQLSEHFSKRPWLSATGTGLVGLLFVVFAARLAL